MKNSSGNRSRWTILALVGISSLFSSFVLATPAEALASPTDLTSNCIAPVELSASDQSSIYGELKDKSSSDLLGGLVCFSTASSDPRPGGELKFSMVPRYSGVQLNSSPLQWKDNGGNLVATSNLTADGQGGLGGSLKLTDALSGKSIHAELGDIEANLSLQEVKNVPDLWDELCLADEQMTEKQFCKLEEAKEETVEQQLRLQGGFFRTPDQQISYAPVILSKVTISGTALGGSVLNSSLASGWKANTVSYQWLKNGVPIPKATGSKYTVTNADRGTQISLRVIASSPGQASVTQVSAKTAKVLGKLIRPNPRVSLTNSKIKCPQWNCKATMQVKIAQNPGAIVKYQWYRNGKAIKGATKSTYTVKYGYSKKAKYSIPYTATVTVSKPGYRTEVQSSTSTAQAFVKLPK